MSEPGDRPEVEIIPPGQPDRHGAGPRGGGNRPGANDPRVFMWSSDQNGTHLRYRQGRPGPLGLILVFLILGGLSVLGFLVFLGLAAIAVPLLGALILGGIVAGILRRL